MTRHLRTLAVVAVLMPVVASALAGCGSNDSGDTADEPQSTVTVTQTVPATPTTATTSGGDSTTPTTPTEPTTSATSEPPVDLSAPPTTFDAAMAHIATAAGSVQTNRFATPSGNIYCALGVKYIPPSCELGEGTIPDPSYCGNGPASTAIGRIEFDKGVATPICNSDTIRQPGAQSLDYGTIAMSGSVECLSETIGVTCVDTRAQSGFFLAKGSYNLFSPGG